jgi:tRNA A-37 threonylcarbamoyl transferase component Bud32
VGISGMQGGRLPEEVAAILPKLARKTGCDDWSLARSPLQRRDCVIYFLHSESFRLPDLVLKIYRKDEVAENLAEAVHRKCKRFHQAGSARFGVPEPVVFLREENAMVMEFVEAPSAALLLMKGFYSRERRRDVIRKAAGWLRWFHESSGVVARPFEAKTFVNPLQRTVEKIEAIAPGSVTRDTLLGQCVKSAGEYASEMEGMVMPHATAHGDFTPFNLFIQGDRTVGFDFRAHRRLAVTHDICRFLLYLDVYQIHPANGREVRRFGCRHHDLEGFMEAYGMEGARLDDALWRKLQFMEITRRITSLALPRTKLSKRMLGIFETARLRRNASLILRVRLPLPHGGSCL